MLEDWNRPNNLQSTCQSISQGQGHKQCLLVEVANLLIEAHLSRNMLRLNMEQHGENMDQLLKMRSICSVHTCYSGRSQVSRRRQSCDRINLDGNDYLSPMLEHICYLDVAQV